MGSLEVWAPHALTVKEADKKGAGPNDRFNDEQIRTHDIIIWTIG